uniref:Phage protein n=1 Tax=Klebsiella phage PMBT12 TaxID=3137283 RepID=A0AAU8BU15_9VIRU
MCVLMIGLPLSKSLNLMYHWLTLGIWSQV